MATSKPDIVIVAGAWHPPAAYDELRKPLESQGYNVHVPYLPTLNGSRPPNADLYTDSEAITKLVTELADAGRSVAVLMHSYGGQVGTNALCGLSLESRKQQNLPGGVIRLVYFSGAVNLEGETMMDLVDKMGHTDFVPIAFDFAEDKTCISSDPKTLVVGPGLSDEALQNYVDILVRFNGFAMYQPLKQCSWREIPVSYIFATNDMTFPMDYQNHMVAVMEAAGREVQKFTLETGHCPNITMPEELAKIVDQILA